MQEEWLKMGFHTINTSTHEVTVQASQCPVQQCRHRQTFSLTTDEMQLQREHAAMALTCLLLVLGREEKSRLSA